MAGLIGVKERLINDFAGADALACVWVAAVDVRFLQLLHCFARMSGKYGNFEQAHPQASSLRRTRNRLPSANSVNRCARFLTSPR